MKPIITIASIFVTCMLFSCQKTYNCKCNLTNLNDSVTNPITAKNRKAADRDCKAKESSKFVICKLI